MSDHLELHDNGDEHVTGGLRRLYAAPADEAYWHALEARILSRLADTAAGGASWWEELGAWARPALVAAALVLLTVSVAMFRSYQTDQRMAYEAMLTPTPYPVETAVRPVLQGQREATFRYLMTSR